MTGRGNRALYQTRQRYAVLRALARTRGFISAQDLHARMRRTGDRVGLATVYRALHTLVDTGQIETIRDTTGERLFQWCPHPGCTHFLVCSRCTTRVPIDAQPAQDWATTTATEHGFADIDLVVEITGVCSRCAPAT